jgi:mannosyl-oligosaccharide alpha-1,3-glucosidase
VPAPLDKVPLFIRGGSIIPTRERPRRSSPLMKHDPFTLRVALSQAGAARGELYLDDGDSYDHRKGNILWREFSAETQKNTIKVSSKDLASSNLHRAVDGVSLNVYDGANAFVKSISEVRVEKVVVLGLKNEPKKVALEGGSELKWTFEAGVAASGKTEGISSKLTIKDPKVQVANNWIILIEA